MPQSAKEMRQLKEKVNELGDNIDSILSLESDIKTAKDSASEAKTKVEKISETNAELVDEVKKLQSKKSELQDQFDELDMKIQEGKVGGSSANIGKEVASEIAQDVEAKNLSNGRPSQGDTFKANLDGYTLKDITNIGGAGDVVFPDEREDIISKPVLRTPQIMDLVTMLETSKDAVEYIVQSLETDNAGPQAGQGAALDQSDFEFTLETDPVETLGHIGKASVQILNDAPRLRTWVNTRMRALLELELEDQVLLGDGTGNNLDGLVPNATGYYSNLESAIADSPVTDIDKIGVMLAQLQRQNFPPTGIVLSPVNWWGILLTKDGDDQYQISGAQNMASPRLWGFPIVSSNAMPEGEALVGNFEMAASFFDRRQTTLEIATENADDFEKLMVTIRAFVRGLLAVQRPLALVHNSNMDTSAPTGS